MKKILPILLALFLILPVTNVFAANDFTEGLLDNPELINSSDFPELVTDNNLNTNVLYQSGAQATWKVVFNKPVDLNGYYIKYEGSNFSIRITYLSETGSSETDTFLAPTNAGYTDIEQNNVTSVSVHKYTSNSFRLYEFDLFGEPSTEEISRPPISNLKETHDYETVDLTWLNPTDINFVGVLIKKNGIQIAEVPKITNTYKVRRLIAETTYEFEVIAKYSDGGISPPVSLSVTTNSEPPPPPEPEPAGEIIDLTAVAKHNRVDLSWTLPKSENFHHVNIYRDTVTETAFIDQLLGIQSVSAATTEIFETNGTYFNDLTVKPETTYEYTLTTTSVEGLESDGVTTIVTTLEKPMPEIIGGGFEKDPISGDFIYYWEEPSEGQVKIIVGGNPYKTVSAASKRIIIPKNEMKYTVLGEPDVSLVAIDQEGNESPPIKPPLNGEGGGSVIENVKTPFSPGDLLAAGTGLLWIVGPFVLLSLAFLLVPKLRGMLFNALGRNNGKAESTRRFRSLTEPTDREPRERVVRERTLKEPKEQRIKAERVERTMRAPRERVRVRRMTRAERS